MYDAVLQALTADLGIYDALNLFCFFGWGLVLHQLITMALTDPSLSLSPFQQPVSPWLNSLFAPFNQQSTSALWLFVFGLEFGCWIDVVRMLLGSLRGNLVLGVCLHFIRTFMLCSVLLPGEPGDKRHSVAFVVLATWAITELARYPCYIKPCSITQAVRSMTPIITFPLGAGFEAIGAVLFIQETGPWENKITMIAAFLAVFNVVGGLYSYPGLVNKGLRSLNPHRYDQMNKAGSWSS